MGKVKFILEEFLRSFQQSLIKNILLMIMFSICLLMTVTMSSYYLDLGERVADDVSNYDEDGKWYYLRLYLEDCDFDEYLLTKNGSLKIMKHYERLCNIENHPVMSVNTYQYVLLMQEEVNALFNDRDCRGFQPEDTIGSFKAMIDNISATYMPFKAVWLDTRAYDYFGLKTAKGEGLTADNTILRDESDCVPVVLGADYDGIVSVGQRIQIVRDGCDYIYQCKVAGILDRHSNMPDFGANDQEMISLDSYIIFPFGIKMAYDTDDNEKIARYALLDSRALMDSKIFLSHDNEFREVVESIGQIARECQMPPLRLYGASMGLKLLRNESAESVRLMLIISIMLICFTFYALFITFYNKIQDNQAVYGIYLMNGCSTLLILIPFVLEIAVLLLPSLFVSNYILNNLGVYKVVVNLVYYLVAASFIIGVSFLALIIKRVDTEYMLKNKY